MAKSKKTLRADRDPAAHTGGDGASAPNPPRRDRADDIARRAYERYQTRGGAHGSDQQDWFEAERSILDDDDDTVADDEPR